MKRDRRQKPECQLRIARERIAILFDQAEREFKNDPKLADRYVFLARKIGMRFNVHLTPAQRKKFCHKCYHYLMPGANCTVRTNQKTQCVEYTCLDCNKTNRYGYSKEKAK